MTTSALKLTKNEYREQKHKLSRLEMYLPTLKLKKSLLQAKVLEAQTEYENMHVNYQSLRDRVMSFAKLFGSPMHIDVFAGFQNLRIVKRVENIVGIEVTHCDAVHIELEEYSLLDTPAWIDPLVELVREFITTKIYMEFAQRKLQILTSELRNVSIRVNLFEKKLIPNAQEMIKKIAIFLGDRSMSEVGQSKLAKKKLEARMKEKHAG